MRRDRRERVGMSGGEKLRFYLLVIALVAVGGMIWHLNKGRREQSGVTSVRLFPEGSGPPMPSGERKAKGPAPFAEGKVKEPAPFPGEGPAEQAEPELSGLPEQRSRLKPPSIDVDPPQPYDWGDPAPILAKIQDATEGLEPEPLAYLLHKVRTTPSDAPEREDAPKVTQEDLALTREQVGAGDNPMRGRWVKLIGTVYGNVHEAEPVVAPGPSGVYQIFRTFVFDKGGKANIVYAVHDEPRLSRRDDVEVEGVFFKLLAYENERYEMVVAPAIIAERLNRYVALPTQASVFMDYVLPGVLVLGGVALVAVLIVGGTRGIGSRGRARRPNRTQGPGS